MSCRTPTIFASTSIKTVESAHQARWSWMCAEAIDLASRLTREVGFEPVLIGDLAKGRYLVPGTALADLHTAAELRQIDSTLR